MAVAKRMCWALWIALVCGGVCSADYLIDADLSDWGVTPFVDWQPEGSADLVEADGVNTYNAVPYAELYDVEAIYFDDDELNIYVAIVESYPMGSGSWGGDLGIDLDGDVTVSEHGVVTGLEFAVRISTETPGDILADPVWLDTETRQWPDGWQGSPYRTIAGRRIGTAQLARRRDPFLEHGTSIAEIAIPRDVFTVQLMPGDIVTLHISQFCGNDSLNLSAIVNVPEPATVLLLAGGVGLMRRIRRRR